MSMLLTGVVACLGVAQAVNIVFEPLPAGAPKGESYRRLEDPHIPLYVHGHAFSPKSGRELQSCNANQQVHLILGGAGTGSVSVILFVSRRCSCLDSLFESYVGDRVLGRVAVFADVLGRLRYPDVRHVGHVDDVVHHGDW